MKRTLTMRLDVEIAVQDDESIDVRMQHILRVVAEQYGDVRHDGVPVDLETTQRYEVATFSAAGAKFEERKRVLPYRLAVTYTEEAEPHDSAA